MSNVNQATAKIINFTEFYIKLHKSIFRNNEIDYMIISTMNNEVYSKRIDINLNTSFRHSLIQSCIADMQK